MTETVIRTLRIRRDEWDAAKAKAEANETTVSEVVREALRDYVVTQHVRRRKPAVADQ